MKRTAVINVVGLTSSLIGKHTPFLRKWSAERAVAKVKPLLPAVTCSMQSAYLTGCPPSGNGIVGNGWYFREECEVKFWRQSNKLVQAPKIWEVMKREYPSFTCANLFWWYNMYSDADYTVTPRPQYHADGIKVPDIYTQPAELRTELQELFGTFPLFDFWGPRTSIRSSSWIADAAMKVERKYLPSLSLIYLPHLDYCFQRNGSDAEVNAGDLGDIDSICESLCGFFESRNVEVVILSEYGITSVHHPVHLNRVLREAGLLEVREENGKEVLDAGSSAAFAVADHQLAHIYIKSQDDVARVKTILEKTGGVEQVLDKAAQETAGLAHERSGELVCVADRASWFTYYYWLDDNRAPDFARTVDIHRKPGYDPCELLIDPEISFPSLKAGMKLLRKKMGFRYLMDLIPLNAELIKGSHGRIPESKDDWPVLIAKDPGAAEMQATEVFSFLLSSLRGT